MIEDESSCSSKNSSEARDSVLSIHKRRNTAILPILSGHIQNNDSKSPMNCKSDSNSNFIRNDEFDNWDIKHNINGDSK